jgi:ABC-type branched-subunit amino acid transport system substrate-binding protein
MKRTMVLKTVAVLGAASLALAACSSDSEDTTASATTEETSAEATAEEAATDECTSPSLVLGSLLPATGDLAFLGPPEFAGIELALQEIDAAGGVLGGPVTYIEGDSGDTTTDIASQTVDSQLAQGVQAIIGAASSGVSLTVIDKITSNNVVQFSPANTAPALTTYPDNGFYFRNSPSDSLQGAVIAADAIDAGFTNIAVVARQDPYGEGLAQYTVDGFVGAGGTVVGEAGQLYDPASPDFAADVAKVKAGNPEAVVVIGFEETTKFLQEMIKQDIGPDKVQVYLVDGNLSATAFENFPAGTMNGVKGTVPTGSVDLSAFNDRLLAYDPALTDFTYGPQSYDAVNVIALAAEKAGCADGPSIAANLADVAGNGGEACTTYADCSALLKEGKDIDYQGVTGSVDFNEYGDLAEGTISVNEYTSNTEFSEIASVTSLVPLPQQ